MAKIKNVSGDDRIVPGLFGRVVYAGQEVDIDDVDTESYLCQPSIWSAADDATAALHAETTKPVEPSDPPSDPAAAPVDLAKVA